MLQYTCTTQSAPSGRGAPVLTRAHCPRVSGLRGVSPAATTACTLRLPTPSRLRHA